MARARGCGWPCGSWRSRARAAAHPARGDGRACQAGWHARGRTAPLRQTRRGTASLTKTRTTTRSASPSASTSSSELDASEPRPSRSSSRTAAKSDGREVSLCTMPKTCKVPCKIHGAELLGWKVVAKAPRPKASSLYIAPTSAHTLGGGSGRWHSRGFRACGRGKVPRLRSPPTPRGTCQGWARARASAAGFAARWGRSRCQFASLSMSGLQAFR
mmetsp:Transcript_43758/g.135575  ORF Transcript_43758/g.135575 Transcript_43758/m.135575 type:complete len:216 (+) Transcript_43758:306-953(+)